jgi:hypothetical protein
MRLLSRLAKLEALAPRRRASLPADPLEFIYGLATGRVTAADIDRADCELMNTLALVHAHLIQRKATTG